MGPVPAGLTVSVEPPDGIGALHADVRRARDDGVGPGIDQDIGRAAIWAGEKGDLDRVEFAVGERHGHFRLPRGGAHLRAADAEDGRGGFQGRRARPAGRRIEAQTARAVVLHDAGRHQQATSGIAEAGLEHGAQMCVEAITEGVAVAQVEDRDGLCSLGGFQGTQRGMKALQGARGIGFRGFDDGGCRMTRSWRDDRLSIGRSPSRWIGAHGHRLAVRGGPFRFVLQAHSDPDRQAEAHDGRTEGQQAQ